MRIVLRLLVIALLASFRVDARDLGQWLGQDTAIVSWYRALMQPDNPVYSCCGEADAYWADDVHVRNGRVFVAITDDRPDGPLRRPHREIGEEYEIPDRKMKWDQGNPTGHAIIFLTTMGVTVCYVPNQGT